MSLAYGLNTETRPSEAVAWGARLIWPNDLVHDRQSWDGGADGDADREALMTWLNSGVLRLALDRLASMAREHELRPDENREVPLIEDLTGVVVANPNRSHGYVYVAAWLLPTR